MFGQLLLLLLLLAATATRGGLLDDRFSQEQGWHEILGTTPEDDVDTISRRYRDLSLMWHPDKCSRSGKACSAEKKEHYENQQRKLSEAYSGLKDLISAYPNRSKTQTPSANSSKKRKENVTTFTWTGTSSFSVWQVIRTFVYYMFYYMLSTWPFGSMVRQGVIVPLLHILVGAYKKPAPFAARGGTFEFFPKEGKFSYYATLSLNTFLALACSGILMAQWAGVTGPGSGDAAAGGTYGPALTWLSEALSVISSIYLVAEAMYLTYSIKQGSIQPKQLAKGFAAFVWYHFTVRYIALCACLAAAAACLVHGYASISFAALLPATLLASQHAYGLISFAAALCGGVVMANRGAPGGGLNMTVVAGQVNKEFFSASSDFLNYINRTLKDSGGSTPRYPLNEASNNSICQTFDCLRHKFAAAITLEPLQQFKLGLAMALFFGASILVWRFSLEEPNFSSPHQWYDQFPLVPEAVMNSFIASSEGDAAYVKQKAREYTIAKRSLGAHGGPRN
jgi:hypothetical protein